MTTITAEALAAGIRAVTGAAIVHNFDPFWPFSPATRAIVFERTVSHGRGRPRTYDKLSVVLDLDTGEVIRARLVIDGAETFADVAAGRHPFDVLDEFLLDR